MSRSMWEILVPTVNRVTGKPYRTRFHKVWDDRVKEISGGLTILTPTKGKWVSPDGILFVDRMIPVRIIASREEIIEIVDITIKYYNELAVLCYKISDDVILKYAEK